MDDSMIYAKNLNEIRRKSIKVKEIREKHNHVLRRSNCSKTTIISDSNLNQTKDQKSNEDQPKKWLSHEKWNKMTIDQRHEHLNKLRRALNTNISNQSIALQLQQNNPPSQYSMANSTITERIESVSVHHFK